MEKEQKEYCAIFTGSPEPGDWSVEDQVNIWLGTTGKNVVVVDRLMGVTSGINSEGRPYVNTTIALFFQPLVSLK